MLTEEADKRGIWVIQMFYNIFVSKPFAEHHGIKTQLSAPTPLVADYNRKSITQFMEMYPNVGLLVCLGEALKGQANQEAWMNDTVIPGVKNAMAALGKTEEPPIVVRAHSVGDVKAMVESALTHYTNLYTMAKYNGESLTSYEPRGKWQQVHLDMSRLGSTHVVNVHLLSNLEPFRYGNTLQTGHRRIPIRGMKGDQPFYYHWTQMLPLYEKELEDFKNRVAHLDEEVDQRTQPGPQLKGVVFELLSKECQTYEVKIGAEPFTDRGYTIL